MAPLVFAYCLVGCGAELESGQSVVVDTCFRSDGGRLPRKRGTMPENPLLLYRAAVPSGNSFRRSLGIRSSQALSAHCSGRIMRCDMCGDSTGQVSKTSTMLLTMPQEGYGCREKQGCLRQVQVPLFVAT